MSQFHFSYFLPTVRSCCRECQQLLAGVRCWLEEEALYLMLCFHRAYLALKEKKQKTSNFSVCIYCQLPRVATTVTGRTASSWNFFTRFKNPSMSNTTQLQEHFTYKTLRHKYSHLPMAAWASLQLLAECSKWS